MAKTKTFVRGETPANGAPVNENTTKGKKGPRSRSHTERAGGGTQTSVETHAANAGVHSGGGASGVAVDQDVLLTTTQAARKLGFSVRKVRQYVRSGKLPAVRLNKRDIRFHWPSVIKQLTSAQQ